MLHKDSCFDRNAEISESLCFHCRDSYKTFKLCDATIVEDRDMNQLSEIFATIVTFSTNIYSSVDTHV